MINSILYYVYYGLVLVFGVFISSAFASVELGKKNCFKLVCLCLLCGLLQLLALLCLDETAVWKLYPLITHLPLLLMLCLYYHKQLPSVISSISAAYLCCQPSKWVGLFVEHLVGNSNVALIVQCATLMLVGYVLLRYFTSFVSEIYNKDTRSVCIFGITPMVYYVFDYSVGIYGNTLFQSREITFEFLAFFLCIVYFVFCIIYYREYEKKSDAERKEHMIRFTIEQQQKEIAALRQSEQETRLLRHDMRLLLSNLAVCIQADDKENAEKIISGYISQVDATAIHRICDNDSVNYVLLNYEARSKQANIKWIAAVEPDIFIPDEIIFSSILSNALDNALEAQKDLPEDKRYIRLMLKTSNSRLLLSVKNPFRFRPNFVDGLPISSKVGHGYGVQSIRALTERLGGNYLFTTEDDTFILRIVI